MRRTFRYLPLQWVLLSVLLSAPMLATAQTDFNRLVVFGDSLSDPGNAFVLIRKVSVRPFLLIPQAPYAIGGLHFSNGETWIEALAKQIKLHPSAEAAYAAPRLFSNYAVGGARARTVGPFDFSAQLGSFLADHGGYADPQSLVVVFFGGNDIRDALEALAVDPSGTSSAIILQQAVTAIIGNMTVLASAGAQHFVVANAPNLGLVPAVRLQGPSAQDAAQTLSALFNQALAGALANLQLALPINVATLDVFSILNGVVAAPQTVGLTNAQDACITPGVVVQAICNRPDDYLFWDGIHPTRAGHRILADEAVHLLGGP